MNGISDNTRKTYVSGWKVYCLFCQQTGINVFPITEYYLQMFVSSAAMRLSYATMKTYLCGVRHYCLMAGMDIDLKNMEGLKVVMRGIKRQQGRDRIRAKRQPIEIEHLLRISNRLRGTLNMDDFYMIMAALTLGFFGLLRSAEFTADTKSKLDRSITLTRRDISFNVDCTCMSVNIKVSKTDPFREGTVITLPKLNNILCPVRAMVRYLKHAAMNGPLFQFRNGVFLTRQHIAYIFKQFLDREVNLNTHSLRIGGATQLSKAGVPEHIIQKIGRWSSDCYTKYVRLTPQHIYAAYFSVGQHMDIRDGVGS